MAVAVILCMLLWRRAVQCTLYWVLVPNSNKKISFKNQHAAAK